MRRLLFIATILLLVGGALGHAEDSHSGRTPEQILENHREVIGQYDSNEDNFIDLRELGKAATDYSDGSIKSFKLSAIESAYNKEINLSKKYEDQNEYEDEDDGQIDSNQCTIRAEGKLVDGEPVSGTLKFDPDASGSSNIEKERKVRGRYSVSFTDMPCGREDQNIQVWRNGELWGHPTRVDWDLPKRGSKTFEVDRVDGTADFALESANLESRTISDYRASDGELTGEIIIENKGGTEDSSGTVRPVLYDGEEKITQGDEISIVDFPAAGTLDVPFEIDQWELRSAAKSLGDSRCKDITSSADLRIEILTRRYFGENSERVFNAGEISFNNMIKPQGPKAKLVSTEFEGSFPGKKSVTVELKNNRCGRVEVTPVFETVNEDKDSKTIEIPKDKSKKITLTATETISNPQMVLEYKNSDYAEILRDDSNQEDTDENENSEEEPGQNSELGEKITYYKQFNISEINQEGRIEMAGGMIEADSEDDNIGLSGLLEIGEEYQAKFIRGEDVIVNKTVRVPSPDTLDSRNNEPVLRIKLEPQDRDENEEPEEKNQRITINTPSNARTGEKVSITLEAAENEDKQYQTVLKSPEGEKVLEETFSKNQKTLLIKPEKSGKYTLEVYPKGTLQSIISTITGPIAEKKFTVTSTQEKWKDYCRENNYDIQNLNGQINCIQNNLVPNYFQNTIGERPQVAESLCNDLLGYSYSKEQKACVI